MSELAELRVVLEGDETCDESLISNGSGRRIELVLDWRILARDNILLAARENYPWPASSTFSNSLNTPVFYRNWFFKSEHGSYVVHSMNRLCRPAEI